MKKNVSIILGLLMTFMFSMNVCSQEDSISLAIYDDPAFTDIDKQYLLVPEAPDGYKWAPYDDFTDEFDGNVLNEDKWYAKSPFWKNGRAPATFKANTVHVNEGNLKIINTVLDPTEDVDGKPGTKYRIACGAVASKAEDAMYGYYSCRMKASQISMSSTFWMNTSKRRDTTLMLDGKMRECALSQELDIQETVGAPQLYPGDESKTWVLDTNKKMGSNTHFHVRYKGDDGKYVSYEKAVGGDKENIVQTDKVYHVYGCWRKSATEILFYLDGKYVYTINPSKEYSNTPFNQGMFMHLVTETYDWAKAPEASEFEDSEKCTTYYDWVRSYRLVKK